MTEQLIDDFGRRVRYVRISVTDRCDFRCVYCMSEEMTFLPRAQVLTLEELAMVARAFTELGVEKIRLTGGEPLVRKGIEQLVDEIGALPGLDDFTMTTNGASLRKHAKRLYDGGLRRLNISLDSLNPERFKQLTRTGDLAKVIDGIHAAKEAGFKRIKLNAVILKGRNEDEVLDLVTFARQEGLDISFIEEMPLGDVSDHSRAETFYSSDDVQALIETRYPLMPTTESTPGRRVTSKWPTATAGWALSRPTATTSAIVATAYGSPWKAACCSAWVMSTRWTCAPYCAAILAICRRSKPPLLTPYRLSPNATTSPPMATCRWCAL